MLCTRTFITTYLSVVWWLHSRKCRFRIDVDLQMSRIDRNKWGAHGQHNGKFVIHSRYTINESGAPTYVNHFPFKNICFVFYDFTLRHRCEIRFKSVKQESTGATGVRIRKFNKIQFSLAFEIVEFLRCWRQNVSAPYSVINVKFDYLPADGADALNACTRTASLSTNYESTTFVFHLSVRMCGCVTIRTQRPNMRHIDARQPTSPMKRRVSWKGNNDALKMRGNQIFENRRRLPFALKFMRKRTLYATKHFVSFVRQANQKRYVVFQIHWWCCRCGTIHLLANTRWHQMPQMERHATHQWTNRFFFGVRCQSIAFGLAILIFAWKTSCHYHESRKILHLTFRIALRWFNNQSLNRIQATAD